MRDSRCDVMLMMVQPLRSMRNQISYVVKGENKQINHLTTFDDNSRKVDLMTSAGRLGNSTIRQGNAS